MSSFNRYADAAELLVLKKLFEEEGEPCRWKRGEVFQYGGETVRWVVYVEKGIFRHTCSDDRGESHVVGYTFAGEYACDYRSYLVGTPAVVEICAATEVSGLRLPIDRIMCYWDENAENQRIGRRAAEELFVVVYDRLLDCYTKTPEEHYLSLLRRYPDLKEAISLKELASFIGVTPETISHIRRRLSSKKS